MPPHTPRWTLFLAAATLTLATTAACDDVSIDFGATPTETTTTSGAKPGSADSRLDQLKVATAGSMKGYSRERFPHWKSTGSNCDVRDSVLKRDGSTVKLSGCNVVAGT